MASKLRGVIANPIIVNSADIINRINDGLYCESYRNLWLPFNYDDIRYIIVPDIQARIDIIDTISSIPDSQFLKAEQAQLERYILISKILVLDEVRKDW